MSFMALWIAFNAYCYGRYSNLAVKPRADLNRGAGLEALSDVEVQCQATISRKSDRIKLQVQEPARISILIAERYTEDLIFSEFAKQAKPLYESLLTSTSFHGEIVDLQQALRRGDSYYVINMARMVEYDPDNAVDEMARRNIIVAFNDLSKLTQLKSVLYQIRCNLFHGEKLPGELNDDRIVRAALPVLRSLLRAITGTPV